MNFDDDYNPQDIDRDRDIDDRDFFPKKHTGKMGGMNFGKRESNLLLRASSCGIGGGYHDRSEKRSKVHAANFDDYEFGETSFNFINPRINRLPNIYVKTTTIQELIPFSPVVL